MAPGLKSVSLGVVSYAALVPENLARTKKKLSLRQAIAEALHLKNRPTA